MIEHAAFENLNPDFTKHDLIRFGFCSSPYRAIQALLNGAKEIEQKNEETFQTVLKTILGTSAAAASPSSGTPKAYVPAASPYFYYQPVQYGVLDELMRNFFIKKVMKDLGPGEQEKSATNVDLDAVDQSFPETVFVDHEESSQRTVY